MGRRLINAMLSLDIKDINNVVESAMYENPKVIKRISATGLLSGAYPAQLPTNSCT